MIEDIVEAYLEAMEQAKIVSVYDRFEKWVCFYSTRMSKVVHPDIMNFAFELFDEFLDKDDE